VIVSAFTFFGSYALYWLVDRMMTIRVGAEQEHAGLDVTQHGEAVSPA
jgi:Amt family ammonium transporter